MLKKSFSLAVIISIGLSLLISSCKKSPQAAPSYSITDKTIALNGTTSSAKDTLFVTRDKSSVLLKVNVQKPSGNPLKRLYVFKRTLDPSNTGNYETVASSNFTKDANGYYYYSIPASEIDTTSSQIAVDLRMNDTDAVMDEFYFTYTDDTDYAGPASNTGVIIGPAQFIVVYGKLTLYQNKRIYNSYSTNTSYLPGYDITYLASKTNDDAAADKDLYENTDNNPLFLGKFKSTNNTSFVKVAQTFPYANATDKAVEAAYILGAANEFTETPDSVAIGDIYLMKLRGDDTKYAAMKILYIVPEDGRTGAGFNNEYILFSVRK